MVSAVDGKDALTQLKEAGGKVDLVLMDMMMQEMDGYESTRQIRNNLAYRNLPVIAVTAKAMTRRLGLYYQTGGRGSIAVAVKGVVV